MDRKNKVLKYIIWSMWSCIILYRVYIIFAYCCKWMDDDQGLMWYGTAAFGHFFFPEPMFFGQAYGSMLESILAVPLYWIGIPLNVAMPIATTIMCVFPFTYMTYQMIKEKKMFEALLLTFIFSCCSWEFDVLTSVPRSFISGFPVAILGSIWILEKREQTGKKFLGALLMALGAIMTTSTISIVGIVGLYYLLTIKERKRKEVVSCCLGGIVGGVIYGLINTFYIKNPDYLLHGSRNVDMNFSTDVLNLNLGKNLYVNDSLISNGTFLFIVGIIGIFVLLVYKKQVRFLCLIIVAIIGTLYMTGMTKTLDYREESLLFGQMRMFLFIPFLVSIMIYLYSLDAKTDFKLGHRTITVFGLCFLTICTMKFIAFRYEVNNTNSALYDGSIVNLQKVENITTCSETVINKAREAGVDVIIQMNDQRGFGYALAAKYYGEFAFYNAFYDRRTWVYYSLSEVDSHKCMLVYYYVDHVDTEIVEISNVSVVDWLSQVKGINRRP